jgi:chromosomal replication initiation ATPase DnaA
MTAFGFAPTSTSPAARRLYEAGAEFAQRKIREAQEAEETQKQALAAQAVLAAAEDRRLRRLAVIARVEGGRDLMNIAHPKQVRRMADILIEVSEKHSVPAAEILSSRRHKAIVHARHEAFWRCKYETTCSLPQIARLFNVDHTTVLNGVRVHAERIAQAERVAA